MNSSVWQVCGFLEGFFMTLTQKEEIHILCFLSPCGSSVVVGVTLAIRDVTIQLAHTSIGTIEQFNIILSIVASLLWLKWKPSRCNISLNKSRYAATSSCQINSEARPYVVWLNQLITNQLRLITCLNDFCGSPDLFIVPPRIYLDISELEQDTF